MGNVSSWTRMTVVWKENDGSRPYIACQWTNWGAREREESKMPLQKWPGARMEIVSAGTVWGKVKNSVLDKSYLLRLFAGHFRVLSRSSRRALARMRGRNAHVTTAKGLDETPTPPWKREKRCRSVHSLCRFGGS